MRFIVTLESETREVIETLTSEFIIKPNIDWRSFKLLQYLDAYGDTIFNCNQITDLVTDLKRLNELNSDASIEQVITLAEECRDGQVHTYLCFNGD